MAATITGTISGDSTSPDLLLPWEKSHASANIFHDVQGSPTAWVSIQGARSGEGELRAFYISETDANAALTLLKSADVFTLDYPERTSIEMTFAVDGTVTMQLDEETSDHWLVTFGYREVA